MEKMNKRGSFTDLIFIMIFLVVISITVLIVFKVSNSINTELQASDVIEANGKAAYNNVNNVYSGTLDNSMLFLSIGLSLVALILAGLVRLHPVFFVFFVMLLVILIILSAVFSNLYLEMANTPEFSAEATSLKFTTRIMYILPWFIGIFGFILAIIMYRNWAEDR